LKFLYYKFLYDILYLLVLVLQHLMSSSNSIVTSNYALDCWNISISEYDINTLTL